LKIQSVSIFLKKYFFSLLVSEFRKELIGLDIFGGQAYRGPNLHTFGLERAVTNVKEILSVAGIDAVFFGYYDYAASIGLQGQIDHPKVLQARSSLLEAARQAGVVAAYATWSSMEAKEMVALGFRVITIGSDASFILRTAQGTLEAMKG